jgi:hypothetical protein
LFSVQILLGFPCLIPLLELLHGLVKMVQAQNIYVVDFVEVVKLIQLEQLKLHPRMMPLLFSTI